MGPTSKGRGKGKGKGGRGEGKRREGGEEGAKGVFCFPFG